VKLIRIRFNDPESKRQALGFLVGRFSFTSYATGEVLVVESALTTSSAPWSDRRTVLAESDTTAKLGILKAW
jgi:hypothetical protein